jgi:hypothetical protein
MIITQSAAVSRHALARKGAGWIDILLPKEHGSWSLAFEPVALGLLAAPSAGGGYLAMAVAVGFFARRPLRIAVGDADATRRATARTLLGLLGLVAVGGFAGAVALGGAGWVAWLAPTAGFGAAFAWFDFQKTNRAAAAELAGTVAFAWLPGVFAVLDGRPASGAIALGLAMLIRAVPTVLTLRAVLRGRKSGKWCGGPALAASVAALAVAAVLVRFRLAPWALVWFAALFAARSGAWLLLVRPALRARTLGIVEMALGLLFVGGMAWAWVE